MIVPVDALPPAVPSTLQLTDVFDVPLTLAVNCCGCVVITTAAAPGETLTVMVAGGGGVELLEPPPHAAKPNKLLKRKTAHVRRV